MNQDGSARFYKAVVIILFDRIKYKNLHTLNTQVLRKQKLETLIFML